MELTNELKEKLAACATAEEAKAILDAAGIALSEAELEQISGGVFSPRVLPDPDAAPFRHGSSFYP